MDLDDNKYHEEFKQALQKQVREMYPYHIASGGGGAREEGAYGPSHRPRTGLHGDGSLSSCSSP